MDAAPTGGGLRMAVLEPDKAYVADNLYLPRRFIREEVIKPALEWWKPGNYITGLGQLWRETDDHLIVPREFLKPTQYVSFPFPFIDINPTFFPRSGLTSRIELWEEQKAAAEAFRKAHSGILHLSPGRGKTVLACNRIAELGCPALVVVHNSFLLEQWLEDIPEHLEIPKGEKVGMIQGPTFDWERPIAVAMIHTLANRAKKGKIPPEFYKHFGVVVFDECFDGRTMVTLSTGERRTIKQIVTSRESIEVLSHNPKTGALEAKPVIRKIKKHLNAETLLRIKMGSGGRTCTIVCTKNHKIWNVDTQSYVRADELKSGDVVLRAVRRASVIDPYPPPSICRERFVVLGGNRKGVSNGRFHAGVHKVGKPDRPYYYVTHATIQVAAAHLAALATVDAAFAIQRLRKLPIPPNGRWKRATLVHYLRTGELPIPGFDIHHRDDNSLNDQVDNLEILPRGVHSRHSGNQYQRRPTPQAVALRQATVRHIETILPNRFNQVVYNLEIADNHSYVANDIVVSNCHHLAAEMFSTTAPICRGQRFGLTGTLEREDGTEFIVKYHLGDIFFQDLSMDMIPEVGFQLTPTYIDIKNDSRAHDIKGNVNTSRLRSAVGDTAEGNIFRYHCVKEAVDAGRKIIAISHSLKQIEEMSAMFPGSGVINADTPKKKRLNIIRDCQLTFIIAVLGTEGLDEKSIDTLFFLTPFTSRKDLRQAMGRLQRKAKNKRQPKLIIFDDVHIKPLTRMCRTLRKLLREWGIPFVSYEAPTF